MNETSVIVCDILKVFKAREEEMIAFLIHAVVEDIFGPGNAKRNIININQLTKKTFPFYILGHNKINCIFNPINISVHFLSIDKRKK